MNQLETLAAKKPHHTLHFILPLPDARFSY